MGRLFGTDGVRGLANKDLTADFALKLGVAAARVLAVNLKAGRKRVLIGRDTRISGEFISSAMASGLASAGVDVIDIGVLPTPGIAYLTSKLGVDFGVVISASHNPMPDNGIKLFSNKGTKLDDSIEDEIEAIFDKEWEKPTGANVGKIHHDVESAQKYYLDHLVASISNQKKNQVFDFFPTKALSGLKVVVDASNGAGYEIGPEALRLAGADVIVINASPDGFNINEDCGSTHPKQLQAMVVASGADLGVAFDGDADRCIAVDDQGNLVDGDKIITILAQSLKEEGKLKDDTVVLTVMSNLGTLNALEDSGIKYEITSVGDRYVLEKMLEKDLILGGEQSGHIINLKYSTTGDGILSALFLCDTIVKRRKSLNSKINLSEMVSHIISLPQVLINVSDVDKEKVLNSDAMNDAVKDVENSLGKNGRVLLRASGTEPLIRVMVEAATHDLANSKAKYLVDKVIEIGSL